MTSGQKISFSLLVSMLLFSLFVVEANLKLFSTLETRFYSQTKITEKIHQLDRTGEELDSYISDLLSTLGDYAQNPAVLSYYEHNPSEKSVTDRRNLTESLFNQIPALSGIRIIDVNGRNVHYSSFDESDILKQNGLTKIYKNYSDIIKDSDEIDFDLLRTSAGEKPKLLVDSSRNRMIVSQPFFWFEKYQGGNIIFYIDFVSLRQTLVDMDIFSYAEEFRILSDSDFNGGFVLELPKAYEKEFKEPILENWASKKLHSEVQYPKVILSSTDGNYWTLLTSAKSKYFKVSGVWYKSSFELSKDLIWLIYACVFITVFLVVYLLFSLTSDPVSVTKRKIRNLQLGIIQEYIAEKKEVDWNRIGEQIRFRKKDILDGLKKDLIKKSGKNRDKVEALLENGWNDILKVFDNQSQKPAAPVVQASSPDFSMEELRRMIEEVLKTVKIPVNVAVSKPAVQAEAAETEELEEIDEVSELDEVEPVEEVAELDEVEPVEEVEEIDEVEPVEEVAELDEVEPVEEVEEIDEVEPVEDVAELDEVEPVEEVAELDEVEPVEEVAELDEVEPVEDVAELDEVEPVEEVAELDEVEPVEEVEEIDEVEPVEEVEEFEEIEEALPAGPIEELPVYDEYSPDAEEPVEDKKNTFYSVENLFPEKNEYFEDQEAFIRSERFASVDDLFAEEIALGSGFVKHDNHSSKIMDFKITKVSEIYDLNTEKKEDKTEEKIEELTEEVPLPESKPYFSMTEFAKNDRNVTELHSAEPDTQVIKENDGVFQISENMEFTNPAMNLDFKSLVESVLKK